MKAARYLNWRINRQVNAEDTELITRVQQGMQSKSFTMGPLSDKEVCLKHFCSRMRDIIPVSYTHLDVYKRQIRRCDGAGPNSERVLTPWPAGFWLADCGQEIGSAYGRPIGQNGRLCNSRPPRQD